MDIVSEIVDPSEQAPWWLRLTMYSTKFLFTALVFNIDILKTQDQRETILLGVRWLDVSGQCSLSVLNQGYHGSLSGYDYSVELHFYDNKPEFHGLSAAYQHQLTGSPCRPYYYCYGDHCFLGPSLGNRTQFWEQHSEKGLSKVCRPQEYAQTWSVRDSDDKFHVLVAPVGLYIAMWIAIYRTIQGRTWEFYVEHLRKAFQDATVKYQHVKQSATKEYQHVKQSAAKVAERNQQGMNEVADEVWNYI